MFDVYGIYDIGNGRGIGIEILLASCLYDAAYDFYSHHLYNGDFSTLSLSRRGIPPNREQFDPAELPSPE